jgi:hypothetical protein
MKKDVICVSTTQKGKILWIDSVENEENAEAVIKMAIARQGVEDRFFKSVEHGKFKEGDVYQK